MTLNEAATDFLSQKRIALVGASRHRRDFTRAIFRQLTSAQRQIVPVNPSTAEIEGATCYPDLRAIPGGVDAVLIATPPSAAAAVVRDCITLGIRRVWLHRSFGPGSASDDAVRLARDAGITLIPGGCPMMFREHADFGHKCIGWCLRVTGRLPGNID